MPKKVTWEEDGFLKIEFPYDPGLVELVKGIPGRRWHPQGKYWLVPKGQVTAVVDLLKERGFEFDRATLSLYEETQGEAAQHLTVSQLNLRVREALAEKFPHPLWLVGEISGLERAQRKQNQFLSFELVERDQSGRQVSSVRAVLPQEAFRAIQAKLAQAGNPFQLQDEVTVRVLVQVEVYVPWGTYRVVIKDLDITYTLGEVARRREEILRKLTKEGLVDRNRSLSFPLVPLRVGLITSLGSDAERDVLKTLRESGFSFQVVVHGARVQGRYTEATVLAALEWFRARAEEFDVVLICRGGGARTDLAWFDSEALGRAVATFPLPVVVGIGHEEDRSVLDEVGWRAKTPTAAAQLLVDRVRGFLDRMETGLQGVVQRAQDQLVRARRGEEERLRRLSLAIAARLRTAHQDLRRVSQGLPRAVGLALGGKRALLGQMRERLSRAAARCLREAGDRLGEVSRRVAPLASALLGQETERLAQRQKRLAALDPRQVLRRGFAILRHPSGGVVTSPEQAPPGTPLEARVREGRLRLLSQGGEKVAD